MVHELTRHDGRALGGIDPPVDEVVAIWATRIESRHTHLRRARLADNPVFRQGIARTSPRLRSATGQSRRRAVLNDQLIRDALFHGHLDASDLVLGLAALGRRVRPISEWSSPTAEADGARRRASGARTLLAALLLGLPIALIILDSAASVVSATTAVPELTVPLVVVAFGFLAGGVLAQQLTPMLGLGDYEIAPPESRLIPNYITRHLVPAGAIAMRFRGQRRGAAAFLRNGLQFATSVIGLLVVGAAICWAHQMLGAMRPEIAVLMTFTASAFVGAGAAIFLLRQFGTNVLRLRSDLVRWVDDLVEMNRFDRELDTAEEATRVRRSW